MPQSEALWSTLNHLIGRVSATEAELDARTHRLDRDEHLFQAQGQRITDLEWRGRERDRRLAALEASDREAEQRLEALEAHTRRSLAQALKARWDEVLPLIMVITGTLYMFPELMTRLGLWLLGAGPDR